MMNAVNVLVKEDKNSNAAIMKTIFYAALVFIIATVLIALAFGTFKQDKKEKYQSEEVELATQSMGLHYIANSLFMPAKVPDRDVTQDVIRAGFDFVPDERYVPAMKKLKVIKNNNFPFEEDHPYILDDYGNKVEIIGDGTDFKVIFYNKQEKLCARAKYAVCK